MSTLILLFHPNFANSRTNRALVDAVSDLPDVTIRDEYHLYPTWQPDITAEQRALENADRIIFQFPIEWYSTPSLSAGRTWFFSMGGRTVRKVMRSITRTCRGYARLARLNQLTCMIQCITRLPLGSCCVRWRARLLIAVCA